MFNDLKNQIKNLEEHTKEQDEKIKAQTSQIKRLEKVIFENAAHTDFNQMQKTLEATLNILTVIAKDITELKPRPTTRPKIKSSWPPPDQLEPQPEQPKSPEPQPEQPILIPKEKLIKRSLEPPKRKLRGGGRPSKNFPDELSNWITDEVHKTYPKLIVRKVIIKQLSQKINEYPQNTLSKDLIVNMISPVLIKYDIGGGRTNSYAYLKYFLIQGLIQKTRKSKFYFINRDNSIPKSKERDLDGFEGETLHGFKE